jgi:hypothetical protein
LKPRTNEEHIDGLFALNLFYQCILRLLLIILYGTYHLGEQSQRWDATTKDVTSTKLGSIKKTSPKGIASAGIDVVSALTALKIILSVM